MKLCLNPELQFSVLSDQQLNRFYQTAHPGIKTEHLFSLNPSVVASSSVGICSVDELKAKSNMTTLNGHFPE